MRHQVKWPGGSKQENSKDFKLMENQTQFTKSMEMSVLYSRMTVITILIILRQLGLQEFGDSDTMLTGG